MSTPIYFYKAKNLSNLKPSSLVAVKTEGDTAFSLYVTDNSGLPYPLKESVGGTITAIQNTDGKLVITGNETKTINVAPALLVLINSALQAGDNVSDLTNDAGYLTTTDLSIVGITGSYNDLVDVPTTFAPSAHTHTISEVTNLQTSLNTKVEENAPIVGATHTKITYDDKGLVTGGVDATTADIADSTNRRYVTDADLIDINNLSGVNSGNQTSIVGITGTKAQFNTAVTDGDILYVGDITQYTDELAQDAVGNILTDTATIDFTYNDGLNTISADVKANSITSIELVDNINTSTFLNDGEDGVNPFITAQDLPTLTGYVPYTGATTDVDLGEHQLKTGQLELDQTPTGAFSTAKIRWNDAAGTAEMRLKGDNVILQIGQELVKRVVNKTATNITLQEVNYQVVRIIGATGQRLSVDLAQADSEANSASTLGLVTENIANNQEGFITFSGEINLINTTGSLQGETWIDGDVLYLSPTIAGQLTKIAPTAPDRKIRVGYVQHTHATQGKIHVDVDRGYSLENLHNVKITATTAGKILGSTTEGLWENKTIAEILGYTPVNPILNINTTSPLLGGGNLTTDRTLSIQQSTGIQNGYLSSTDWNTFNNKQPAGNYITSLTGEVIASGAGVASATLSTPAVTGKILTGLNVAGGSISATDNILSAFGKIQNQINGVLGGSIFQTTWNASTNIPILTSSIGTKGYYYIVDVAGNTNLNGITDWKIGDWAIYDGTVWRKVDNTDAVSSVNGFTGAVSLTTSNITEGTNLYYTEGRVSANTDVSANTAVRHNAVTLGTTNGLSLSGQQISLGLSSTSTIGALSSTDWNVFNNKQNTLGFTPENQANKSDSYTASSSATYASTKALVDGLGTKANDANVVHITGDETIAGTKTFSSFLKSGLLFINEAGGFGNVAGYTQLGGTADYFQVINGASTKSTKFIHNGVRILTMPATDGTLALTSNLSAYQPLLSGTGFVKSTAGVISYDTTTYTPSTGGTGYIQNQNASAQSANMWISGTGRFGEALTGPVINAYNESLPTLSNISISVGTGLDIYKSGFLVWQNDAVNINRYMSLETFEGASPIKVLGSNFNVTTAGAATFASSVTATSLRASSTTPTLELFNTTNGDVLANVRAVAGTGTGGSLVIGTKRNGDSLSDKVTILDNGNVGIGTASPANPLTVQSNGSAQGIAILNRSSDDFSNLLFYNYAGSSVLGGIGNSSGRIRIMSGGVGDSFERLSITSNGNVGIGTTSPSRILHLKSGGSEQLVIESTTTKTGMFLNPSNSTFSPFYGATGNDHIWETLGAEKMRITSGGNVLIGTTTDNGSKLRVNGTGYFDGGITANGNSVINGGAGADVLYLQKSTGASLGLSGATGTTNSILLNATNSTNPGLDIYVGGSIRQNISSTGVVKINNLAGAGTRTVVADASGNLSASATSTSTYKVYTALLTQSGTNAPTATVLENTLGGTVVWGRSTGGVYYGTLTGAFTSNKTAIFVTNRLSTDLLRSYRGDVNTVYLENSNGDGNLLEHTIEIRVYN